MDKPRIVSIKEKIPTVEEASRPVPQEPPQVSVEMEAAPPWVKREAIEARKRELPEAAEKIIEEQAKDILPTLPEPGQPFESKKKKGLIDRMAGWFFK